MKSYWIRAERIDTGNVDMFTLYANDELEALEKARERFNERLYKTKVLGKG